MKKEKNVNTPLDNHRSKKVPIFTIPQRETKSLQVAKFIIDGIIDVIFKREQDREIWKKVPQFSSQECRTVTFNICKAVTINATPPASRVSYAPQPSAANFMRTKLKRPDWQLKTMQPLLSPSVSNSDLINLDESAVSSRVNS